MRGGDIAVTNPQDRHSVGERVQNSLFTQDWRLATFKTHQFQAMDVKSCNQKTSPYALRWIEVSNRNTKKIETNVMCRTHEGTGLEIAASQWTIILSGLKQVMYDKILGWPDTLSLVISETNRKFFLFSEPGWRGGGGAFIELWCSTYFVDICPA